MSHIPHRKALFRQAVQRGDYDGVSDMLHRATDTHMAAAKRKMRRATRRDWNAFLRLRSKPCTHFDERNRSRLGIRRGLWRVNDRHIKVSRIGSHPRSRYPQLIAGQEL